MVPVEGFRKAIPVPSIRGMDDARAGVYTSRGPRADEDWQAVAAALNGRMAACRIGQQELSQRCGVSVSTLRAIQHGARSRRVQNKTLAAISRALDWPEDHLTRVLLAAGKPPSPAEDPGQVSVILARIDQRLREMNQPTSPSSGLLAHVSADPAPLFVYGTLLFTDVVSALIDRDPARTPAVVPGWRVVALPNVVYPSLIPHQAGTATGHLLTDLTPPEWQVLDAFEDTRYELAALTTTEGRTAYAYTDANPALTDAPPWDKPHFTETHLHAYLERCTAWRHRYDTSTT